MAKPFLIFASEDKELASFLSKQLQGPAYSYTLKDIDGDQISEQDQSLLGDTSAINVILWTQNSIEKQTFQSLAQAAQRSDRLVSITLTNANWEANSTFLNANIHIEVENVDAIKDVVSSKVRKQNPFGFYTKYIRSYILGHPIRFIAIFLLAKTMFSMIGDAITLSKIAEIILNHYEKAIYLFWKNVLFFIPNISQYDAGMLTVLAIISGLAVRIDIKKTVNRSMMNSAINFVSWSFGIIYATLLVIPIVYLLSRTVEKMTYENSKISEIFDAISIHYERMNAGPKMLLTLMPFFIVLIIQHYNIENHALTLRSKSEINRMRYRGSFYQIRRILFSYIFDYFLISIFLFPICMAIINGDFSN